MSHQDHESLNAVEDLLEINVIFRRMVMVSQSAAKGINNAPLIYCVSTLTSREDCLTKRKIKRG